MSSCVSEDSIYLKSSKLPKRRIDGLGLSFREMAKRGNKLVEEYLFDNLTSSDAAIVRSNTTEDSAEIVRIQSLVRRILSNWVNDENNLKNSNGEYIGDKYGARILVSSSDGYVVHDVQTFCKDIRVNKTGNNNNFIMQKVDIIQQPVAFTVFSTLKSTDSINSTIANTPYSDNKTYKIKTTSIPSSVSPSLPLKYNISVDEINSEQITIDSVSKIDIHTTRKEFIQSSCGRYGYNARRSDTTNTFNWYVCRKWGNELFANFGTMFFVRLSYFEFPQS
jgi:hypothetical protein